MSLFVLPKQILTDSDGLPLAGGKVYILDNYDGVTPLEIYTDSICTIPAANPIVADSAGRLPVVYLQPGICDVVVKDADDNTIYTAQGHPAPASWVSLPGTIDAVYSTFIFKDASGRERLGYISQLQTALSPGSVQRGGLHGMVCSNNVGDPNNDIDISAGRARDTTDAVTMVQTGTITKRLDANWAVGSNQGGLDTGSKANNTLYSVWAIGRTDETAYDYLFSASATAPTMPADYSYKRRVGFILTDGSGNIRAFTQYGDEFILNVPIKDIDDSTTGTSAKTVTVSAPPLCRALFNGIAKLNGTGAVYGRLFSALEADAATASTTAYLPNIVGSDNGGSSNYGGSQISVWVDSSRQLKYRFDAGATFKAALVSWTDNRGRFD